MVILHIANIDPSVLGGVQVAVPKMILAQSKCATAGFFNTNGIQFSDLTMVTKGKEFNLDSFTPPFNKPDIVVFHEIYRPEFIAIYKELNKRSIPYIIVPHGSLTKQAQSRKALKKIVGNLLLFNKYVKNAKALQYLSIGEAEKTIAKNEYFICGNGIEIPEIYKTNFCKNGIKLLYIGRLEIEIKGLDLLVEAVSKSREVFEKSNCKLYIYGPDYDGMYSRLENLITENKVEDLIDLNGAITGENKEAELLSADYYIQTSRSEGMPMGIIEALSYGLPCIVTKGTGLNTAIKEYNAGYECETSVEGIADILKTAVDNYSELEIKSKSARKLAIDKYDRNIFACQTVDNYKRFI